MRRLFLAAAFALAVSLTAVAQQAAAGGGAVAQSNDAEQAVLRLTRDWAEAEAKQDRAALERIIGADFEGTGPGGNRITRGDVLPADGSKGGNVSMSVDDLKAKVFGDAAVVTGRGQPKTGEPLEVRFTLVYAKRQGGWQMVAGHMAVIPPGR